MQSERGERLLCMDEPVIGDGAAPLLLARDHKCMQRDMSLSRVVTKVCGIRGTTAPAMLESSPGYALFTDLRKKMGMTSSQPIPSPSRVANTSMVASPATKRKAHFSKYTSLTRF